MNPIEGVNPHGLENRTLTFHVCDSDGTERGSQQDTTRLFCYATYPDLIRLQYGEEWSLEHPTSTNWSSLQKYVSKNVDSVGTQKHLMIHEDKDLYVVSESGDGIYAQVCIQDTSDSMDSSTDDTSLRYIYTAALSNYFCTDEKQGVVIYDGTYANNIKCANGNLCKLSLGGSSSFTDLDQLYSTVKTIVGGIKKAGGSEAMITCLYYSIAQTMGTDSLDRLFRLGTDQSKRSNLRAINFMLLTDESIITNDTLRGWSTIVNSSSWLSNWQQKASNKFPVFGSGDGTSKDKHTFTSYEEIELVQGITNALLEMSYYYGLNFTWSISQRLSTSDDVKMMLEYTPILANITYSSSSGLELINLLNSSGYSKYDAWRRQILDGKNWTGQLWYMPYKDGVSVSSCSDPYTPMCHIRLQGVTLKSENIMPSYDSAIALPIVTIKNKWHQWRFGSATYYSAFRFFGNDTIKLPTLDQIDTSTPYVTPKWQYITKNLTGILEPHQVDMGSEISIDRQDVIDSDYTITFSLVETNPTT